MEYRLNKKQAGDTVEEVQPKKGSEAKAEGFSNEGEKKIKNHRGISFQLNHVNATLSFLSQFVSTY